MEAGVYTARGTAHLRQLVQNLAEQGFRIVAVIDTQNGDYHVVAQKEARHDACQRFRLRAALRDCVNLLDDLVAESGRGIEYGEEDAFRMGEWFDDHDLMNIEAARAALATPAHDAVQEAAIAEVVQHESTRRWFHGEATHEEIMECVKAMDAAVAKWRAIAGDRT